MLGGRLTRRFLARFRVNHLAILALAVALALWWSVASESARRAWVTTLVFAGLTACLTVVLATVLLPLHLWAHRSIGRCAWLVWFFLLFLPVYVQAAAWQAGTVWGAWGPPGIASSRDPALVRWLAAMCIHVVAGLPWALWIVRSGLNQLDRAVLDSATLEASAGKVYGQVMLVELRPWLALAAIWVAIGAATELFVVDLYLIPTVARQLYTDFAVGSQLADTWQMTAGVWLAGACAIGFLWQPERWRFWRWDAVFLEPHSKVREIRWWASCLLVLVLMGVFALPSVNLFMQAGAVYGSSASPTWSWSRFIDRMAAGMQDFYREVSGTLLTSSLAAALGVLTAYGLACLVVGRRIESAAWGLAIVLALLPGPFVGIGLNYLLRETGIPFLVLLYDRTFLAPVLAAAIRVWPLCWTLTVLAWRNVPRAQWEAAALEAVPRMAFIRHVVWPETRRALTLGGLLAFAWASGELAATLVVLPPGAETVAVRIANLMHTAVREKEAVLCLYHLIACLVVVGAAWRLTKGPGRREAEQGEGNNSSAFRSEIH